MWWKTAAKRVEGSLLPVLTRQSNLSVPAAAASFSSSTTVPIIELREYAVQPGHMEAYMEATIQSASLRTSLSPLRFFSVPETGGQLLVATHAYYYQGGHADRDATRAKMAQNPEWTAYLDTIFPYLDTAQSNIYVEAPLVSQIDGVVGLKSVPLPIDNHPDNSILELRRYQLRLGYDTVPQFLQYYGDGLPSKLAAPGTDPSTSLVTLLYTEVGRLNEVIEIWRHGNGTHAMEQSRVAARSAQEWRTAIAKIADLAIQFTSTIHKPTSFSPLR
ncbi:NIPSNAP [Seminavis robusta]|uniref:NIPSNAP n=1 Tax=Seminavis robusta TaxID=568900 RepID=A0A9N8DGN6_9STRA|nr:NIPSNAP [Seminavis robusta]|eukprot:Sro116_g057190.1 NIPSNAP (274) ;mRNA; r:95846-96667